MFDSVSTKALFESLIGRITLDASGIKGRIISVNSMIEEDRCEISVRFDDNTYLLETRFSAQYWFDKSKEPPVYKRTLIYPKRATNAV
jgi:hypothetical protein